MRFVSDKLITVDIYRTPTYGLDERAALPVEMSSDLPAARTPPEVRRALLAPGGEHRGGEVLLRVGGVGGEHRANADLRWSMRPGGTHDGHPNQTLEESS